MMNKDGKGNKGQGPKPSKGKGSQNNTSNATLNKCTGNKAQAAAIHAQMDKEKKKGK